MRSKKVEKKNKKAKILILRLSLHRRPLAGQQSEMLSTGDDEMVTVSERLVNVAKSAVALTLPNFVCVNVW